MPAVTDVLGESLSTAVSSEGVEQQKAPEAKGGAEEQEEGWDGDGDDGDDAAMTLERVASDAMILLSGIGENPSSPPPLLAF